jgi:hypothetical protein
MIEKTETQLPLFDLNAIKETEPVSSPRWYYYTTLLDDEMIVVGDDGKYHWYEHDLAQIVPCLWNHANTCKAAMRGVKKAGCVKLYPFTSTSWAK